MLDFYLYSNYGGCVNLGKMSCKKALEIFEFTAKAKSNDDYVALGVYKNNRLSACDIVIKFGIQPIEICKDVFKNEDFKDDKIITNNFLKIAKRNLDIK